MVRNFKILENLKSYIYLTSKKRHFGARVEENLGFDLHWFGAW